MRETLDCSRSQVRNLHVAEFLLIRGSFLLFLISLDIAAFRSCSVSNIIVFPISCLLLWVNSLGPFTYSTQKSRPNFFLLRVDLMIFFENMVRTFFWPI